RAFRPGYSHVVVGLLVATCLTSVSFQRGRCWVSGCPGLVRAPRRAELRASRARLFSSAEDVEEWPSQRQLPAEDDEERPSLARWLPPFEEGEPDIEDAVIEDGVTVLPLFHMGGVAAYMPYSFHELSIFEPRYRKLYNDILISGSRRFVVPSVNPDGRLAEVGVVFYLTDLQDVSEETSGEVKYVCNHSVIGRVRIGRVLNPSAWFNGEAYLRAETVPLDDTDGESEETFPELEKEVLHRLSRTTRMQLELDVPQISPDVGELVNASRAKQGGLWSLAATWAEYYEHLLSEKEEMLNEEMSHTYWKDMKEDGQFDGMEDDDDDDEDYDGEEDDDDYDDINMDDLKPALRNQMQKLQIQYEEEADVLMGDLAELVQRLLQSTTHRERLELLRDAFALEEGRLMAKKAVMAAVNNLRLS
ncbi:unnamed protein product, partial [Polarella glacialis]